MATVTRKKTVKGLRFLARVRMEGHRVSGTFETKTDAKAWAAKVETAIRQGKYAPAGERHTFDELVSAYEGSPKYKRFYRFHLIYWRTEFGLRDVRVLRPSLIAEKRDELAQGQTPQGRRSPSTVNRYLNSLSAVLAYGVKELGWLDENPTRSVSRLSEPRGTVRFLSRPIDEQNSELQRLLAACRTSRNKDLYDLVLLGLSTGMRVSEILGLRREQVRLAEGGLTLPAAATKIREERFVPLVGEALTLVRRRLVSAEPHLFSSPRSPGKPLLFPRKAWETALRQAQVADFRFHDLRHTHASYLTMSGATERELMEALGHSTLQMVSRYSHLANAHKRQVAERLVGVLSQACDRTEVGSQ
jgi:integrase